jgi:hypothetical protein
LHTKEAPVEKVVVEVRGVRIVLDPANMLYNENTLAEFMNTEYGWIDYLGKQLEYAQKDMLYAEVEAEAEYSRKFLEAKTEKGFTENQSKAYALAHHDVVAAKKAHIDKKEIVGHIKAHLRAWDKNHENAQNRGHTIRKEMDKLNRDSFVVNDDDATCSVEDILGLKS